MSVTWVEHKGVRILYSDFTGLHDNDKMFPVIEEALRQFTRTPGKVRHLYNFTDSTINKEFMAYVKERVKSIPADKTEKDAYLGVTGVKKVLLQSFLFLTKDPARVFETEKEALDWLAE